MMQDSKVLVIDNLSIEFGGLKAVSNFSMEMHKKELIGLIGPNGAGKTTIFNLITGLYRPTSGTIQLMGEDITDLVTHKRVQKGIARTFQNIRLFKQLTVLENVKVAYHNNMSYGLFSSIFRLLCLDEPAAGMNPHETEELMKTIKIIQEKFETTILLIEHDMKFVMGICDRIYVLNFGELIAEGVPLEIQKNPEVIKAYLGE